MVFVITQQVTKEDEMKPYLVDAAPRRRPMRVVLARIGMVIRFVLMSAGVLMIAVLIFAALSP